MRTSKSSAARRSASPAGESLSAYLKEIGVYRLITRSEEAELGTRIRAGDQAAIDTLVCSNLRFVVAIAKKYRHQGAALEDLINEGNIGLMRAARRFDERRGIRFISYAVWWIRQAVVELLAEQSQIVRVPFSRRGELYRVRKCAADLEQELGRQPTNREIAQGMDVPESEVAEAMSLCQGQVSFDAPAAPDTETRLFDVIADDAGEAPDEPIVENARTTAVAQALSHLPPREARVLRLYFGLSDGEPETLEDIGVQLGVTRERVRQIRDKALSRLRKSREAPVLQAMAS